VCSCAPYLRASGATWRSSLSPCALEASSTWLPPNGHGWIAHLWSRARAARFLDPDQVWPYPNRMAVTTIKSTYALDVETVHTLERMAANWNVSKSEALRRAIRIASKDATSQHSDALTALDELQGSLSMNGTQARAWAGRVRSERQAASRKPPTRS
jgi:ribbon-helix-helix CopG family protein